MKTTHTTACVRVLTFWFGAKVSVRLDASPVQFLAREGFAGALMCIPLDHSSQLVGSGSLEVSKSDPKLLVKLKKLPYKILLFTHVHICNVEPLRGRAMSSLQAFVNAMSRRLLADDGDGGR